MFAEEGKMIDTIVGILLSALLVSAVIAIWSGIFLMIRILVDDWRAK